MAIICPTILASDVHDYRAQYERIQDFAQRIQIDLSDNVFTLRKTITLEQVWSSGTVKIDLHLMYRKPEQYLSKLVKLNPNLVIVHAEAEGNFFDILELLKKHKIKVGIALLPKTPVLTIKPVIYKIDHVLIFSGDLGHFGGVANFDLLEKAKEIKSLNPKIEIGWDGGINDTNAMRLSNGGIDVLNVGGFIQKSQDPKSAYNILVQSINNV